MSCGEAHGLALLWVAQGRAPCPGCKVRQCSSATSQAVCHPPTPFSAMSSTSWPGLMLHPWYRHVGVMNVVCLWSECRTWAGLAACGKLHRCVLPAASSACVALYPKTKHFDLDVMGMKVKANNGSL